VSALRASTGAQEQLPDDTETFVTGVAVSAKIGERGRAVHGGAHPYNGEVVP
jgi:hypothetical protein